jgi:predicted PhzF superfamily epimerase YddE/YHI9
MRDVGIIPPNKPAAIQSCAYGLVTIKFNNPTSELGSSLPAVSLSSPPAFVRPAPALPRLGALGLEGKTEVVSAYLASCGLEFLYVRLKDDDALSKASLTVEGINEATTAASETALTIVLYTVLGEEEGSVKVHQRVFMHSGGEGEQKNRDRK